MSILEPSAGNSVGDLLGALQTTFSYVSPLGFMCLVHEPENIHFWHGNELFTSDYRSFHGLFMVPLIPWLIVLEKRERMAGCSFTALCLINIALCHINNHENQLAKEGCKLN